MARGFPKKITAHQIHMRSLGYKSLIFRAVYKGGKCGLTGKSIQRGADVAYFRNHGLCLELSIRDVLDQERIARAPKCGCGREATHAQVVDGQPTACIVCAVIADVWFDRDVVDVTRDTLFTLHA